MTNKVICVELLKSFLKKIYAEGGELWEDSKTRTGDVGYLNAITDISNEIDRLSPSPAPADGLLPCKLCGCVPNTEPLHDNGDQSGPQAVVCSNELCLLGNMAVAPEAWNKAMSPAPSAQWDVDQCVEFWAGKNAILILEKAWLEAAIEDIEKLIRGAMVLKTGRMASDFTEMDIGWNNALNMVLGYMKKKLPTPTTNTREGM